MSVINLGRTTKTNITFYQTDGMGRDGYITYNNAGFWKDKIIAAKKVYPRKKFSIFHSLIHQPAPFNYYSDGSGRDSYVIENNGGLVKPFEPLAQQKLPKFLRNGDEKYILKHKIFLNKTQRRYLNKIKKIQDAVITRLYNDSLEKVRKKNDLQCRTNSLNNFFTKDKIRPMTGISTPKNELKNLSMSLNYVNSLKNQSGNLKENKEKCFNLKINSHRNKNIFQKYLGNNLKNKENKKIKILKNLRINSSGLKCDFITDDLNYKNNNIRDYNSFNSLSPNYTTNKNLMFGQGNDTQKNISKNNITCYFNNKTFGSFSSTHRNKTAGNGKLIYNLRKRNNIKKYIWSNGNYNCHETDKNNN